MNVIFLKAGQGREKAGREAIRLSRSLVIPQGFAACQHFFDRVEADWLEEVEVETGFLGPAKVLFLTITGDCH